MRWRERALMAVGVHVLAGIGHFCCEMLVRSLECSGDALFGLPYRYGTVGANSRSMHGATFSDMRRGKP